MPPRIPLTRTARTGIFRSTSTIPSYQAIPLRFRCISSDDKPLPTLDKPALGPNQDQLPHVSEEAATMGKITGEGGPELDQGTPVEEVTSPPWGALKDSNAH